MELDWLEKKWDLPVEEKRCLVEGRNESKRAFHPQIPVECALVGYFIAPDTAKRYDIFRVGGGRKTAEKYDAPFLGEIPIAPTICEGGDLGVPAASSRSESPQREAFGTIAAEVAKRISIQNLSAELTVIETN